jgi:hypothetical protein
VVSTAIGEAGPIASGLSTRSSCGGVAEYFVYDPSAPQRDRWLMWFRGNPKTDGCPSFMSASGLTDAEFWRVANSLR